MTSASDKITFKDEPLMLGDGAKHLSLTRPFPNMSMPRLFPPITGQRSTRATRTELWINVARRDMGPSRKSAMFNQLQ
jgi:hypothetical protein